MALPFIVLLLFFRFISGLFFNGYLSFYYNYINYLLGYEIRDLISHSSRDYFPAEISYWQLDYIGSNPLINCGGGGAGGDYYLGGDNVFIDGTKAKREYTNLPSHSVILFQVTVELHGTWHQSQSIHFNFGNQTSNETLTFASYVDNLQSYFQPGKCDSGASSANDLVIWGHVPHSGSTLNLTITYSNPTGVAGSFSFRDVRLIFSSVTPSSSYPNPSWFSSVIYQKSGNVMQDSDCGWLSYLHNPSSSCQMCVPACQACWGSTNAECFSCGTGYYNGSACLLCDDSCSSCNGPDDNHCNSCLTPLYLINKSCISCDPPLIRNERNSSQLPGSFFGYCTSPCEENEFIYPDGACFDSCDPRFDNVTNSTGKFCSSPCNEIDGDVLFEERPTCVPLADCTYPMDLVEYGSSKICEYTCPSGTVKFRPTNLCIPIADCQVPYIINQYFGHGSCEASCSDSPPDYTYWNNSCNNFCPGRMNKVWKDEIPVCNPPLCGIVNCSRCDSNGFCPDFYYCDEYLGNFCLPYYDYYLDPMIIKGTLNGHILQVQVGPSKNGLVPGVNDTLIFSIDNLVVDVDYSVEITHISLGIFEIHYKLLRILNIRDMDAKFLYSPNNLYLQATLEIPRVVFINTGVKKAAENTQASSQLLFLLFILSIIGMIMGGGISALWAALPESQYSYYLIYLNVDYIYQTQLYMQSMSNYDLMVGSDPESEDNQMLDPILKQSLPNRFYVLGYAPDFISNTDQVFAQIFLLVGGLLLTDLLLKHVRFPRQFFFIQKVLDTLSRILKWNGLLRQGLTYTLALSTAAFVQIYNATFGNNPSLFPLLAAITTILVLLWGLIKMYSLIKHTPGDRHGRALHTKLYGTLWDDLNITQTFSKYYYWLTAIRGLVLAYVCVFCDMNTYFQIFVIMFYQLGIVAIFVKNFKSLRPVFCEPTLNRVMLIEELLILLMKVFTLAFVFVRSSASNNALVVIGWLIVLPGACIQGLQIGYSISQQIKYRKKFFRKVKLILNNLKKKKVKKRINRTVWFKYNEAK